MNEPSQEALAGPGLPFDQHRRQTPGVLLPSEEPLDLVADRLDARAFTEQLG
jgi:hypothetical protein